MKKILTAILVASLLPLTALAISVPWERPSVGTIHPPYIGDTVVVGAISTSTDGVFEVNGDSAFEGDVSITGTITSGTWNGSVIDFSDYINATAGTGITFNDDEINAEVQTSDLHDEVTLVGSRDYLTISGQEITRGVVDFGDDTNAVGGAGITITGDSIAADLGDSIDISDETNLAVSGTLLDLTGDTLSINEGTLNAGDFCTFDGTDLVCNTSGSLDDDDLSDDDIDALQNVTLLTEQSQDLFFYNGSAWDRLPVGSNGEVLKVQSGNLTWDTDETGSGGGSGLFATTSPSDSFVYPISNRGIVIGDTATSSNGMFEVNGDSTFEGDIDITGTINTGTWNGTAIDFSDFTNATSGDGITFNNDEIALTNDFGSEIDFSELNATDIITEAEGISSNDNDTTLPTSAAVKDYADTNDSDTQLTQEQVQDFAWNVLGGTQTLITVSYQDGTDDVDFVVDDDLDNYDNTNSGFFDASSDVDHDATTNFVANEHIDHSSVTLTAGTNLNGGGDITANRTFNLDDSIVLTGASSTNATSTNQWILSSLTFDGVTGTAWSDFCVSITGGAGLCDGTDNTGAGGGSPGGSDTQLQFNEAGTFEGTQGLTWATSTNTLTMAGTSTFATTTFNGLVNIIGLEASRLVATDGSKNLVSTITEGNLESSVSGVTNIFTDNDGALDDDDLSDNTLNDLSQTSLADPGADQLVFWDDSDTSFEFISTLTGLTITNNTLSVDTVDFSDGTNATAGDGITFTGDQIDADLGTAIDTTEITNDTILEVDLDATNAASDNQILSFDNASGGFTWVDDQTGGGGGSPAGSDGQIQFNDSGSFGATSTFVWDNTTNRLGIGTSTPNAALHVEGGNVRSDNTGTAANVGAQRTDGAAYNLFAGTGASGLRFSETNSVGADTDFFIASQARQDVVDQIFGGGQTVHLAVTSDGLVGIGTSTPQSRLHVVDGDVQVAGGDLIGSYFSLGLNAGSGLQKRITSSKKGGAATLELQTEDGNGDLVTGILQRGGANDNDIEFYTGASTTESMMMILDGSSESVGIGASTPAGKFEVEGDTAGQIQSVIQGAASQSANLTEWQDSTDSVLSRIGADGVLQLVNGTTPTTDAVGELVFDTNDNQLIVDDGTNDNVIRTTEEIVSVTVASSSQAWDKSLPIPPEKDGYTVTHIECYVTGGTSKVVTLTDGTNDMDSITCGTSVTDDDGSIANSTVTASETMQLDFGATSGSVNYVSFTAFGRYTRE